MCLSVECGAVVLQEREVVSEQEAVSESGVELSEEPANKIKYSLDLFQHSNQIMKKKMDNFLLLILLLIILIVINEQLNRDTVHTGL